MLGVEVSERVANLFGRMPSMDVIKRNSKFLNLPVVNMLAEQGIELQGSLVEANCRYVDLKKSLEDKINVGHDVWEAEVLNKDPDSIHTLNSIRRHEKKLADLNAEFHKLTKSDIVEVAEYFVELHDEVCGSDQANFFDIVHDQDNEEAHSFVRLMRYLAEDAGYQADADEPMPPLEIGPPLLPLLPVVPQAARRPMSPPVVVVDSGDSDEEPDVPLPLRMDVPQAEEKKESDDHFLTDPRSCRRRILKGRGSKTFLDDNGVMRLNTRTVEAHLSRKARAKRYPAEAGCVRLLNVFKSRIEDRIQDMYGDRCPAVSYLFILVSCSCYTCADQGGEAVACRGQRV